MKINVSVEIRLFDWLRDDGFFFDYIKEKSRAKNKKPIANIALIDSYHSTWNQQREHLIYLDFIMS